jgi:hypothetical protein
MLREPTAVEGNLVTINTTYLALLFISAATLAFQVTLTRFFALAQGHHLAFMAISLALLGAGASGTYLSLRPPTVVGLPRLLTTGSTLFTLSVPAAYLAINFLPFDAYRLALERSQLLWLALYYLALTTPFFFGGVVIGATLVAQPGRAGPLYAANLLGSALLAGRGRRARNHILLCLTRLAGSDK